ncbi:hypothetical protein [Paenibacillus sp. 453mf]|uniref:hypothetical protein n=1 Tax=Paenibacillus sp. 453mf TaxID=1761874 RepID=UPI0008E23201|nr:hypothetical protein [Paenibacillus sp. 453mf]SFS76084.1 hypothetical protein SAMN04488601_10334 [Paenibacillus sp. 453mf]
MGFGNNWEVKKDNDIKSPIIIDNNTESERVKRKGYEGGLVFALLGWICALISFLPFTALIAALGVVFGFLSYKLENREIQGAVIMILSLAGGLF